MSFKISLQINVRKGMQSESPGKGIISVTQIPRDDSQEREQGHRANCRRALTSNGIPGIVYPWGNSVHKYFVHRDKREGKAHQEAAGV